MKDKTFCEYCSTEIKKALLYKHINSKEHKEIENFLSRKCMTYCGTCKEEIRDDEWREQIASENHLEIELKNHCKACKAKFDVSGYPEDTF